MADHALYEPQAEADSIALHLERFGDAHRSARKLARNLVLGERELVNRQAAITTYYQVADAELAGLEGESFKELIAGVDKALKRHLLQIEARLAGDLNIGQAITISQDSGSGRSYVYLYERNGSDPHLIKLAAIEHVGTAQELASFVRGLSRDGQGIGVENGQVVLDPIFLSRDQSLSDREIVSAALSSFDTSDRRTEPQINDYLARLDDTMRDRAAVEQRLTEVIDQRTAQILAQLNSYSDQKAGLLEIAHLSSTEINTLIPGASERARELFISENPEWKVWSSEEYVLVDPGKPAILISAIEPHSVVSEVTWRNIEVQGWGNYGRWLELAETALNGRTSIEPTLGERALALYFAQPVALHAVSGVGPSTFQDLTAVQAESPRRERTQSQQSQPAMDVLDRIKKGGEEATPHNPVFRHLLALSERSAAAIDAALLELRTIASALMRPLEIPKLRELIGAFRGTQRSEVILGGSSLTPQFVGAVTAPVPLGLGETSKFPRFNNAAIASAQNQSPIHSAHASQPLSEKVIRSTATVRAPNREINRAPNQAAPRLSAPVKAPLPTKLIRKSSAQHSTYGGVKLKAALLPSETRPLPMTLRALSRIRDQSRTMTEVHIKRLQAIAARRFRLSQRRLPAPNRSKQVSSRGRVGAAAAREKVLKAPKDSKAAGYRRRAPGYKLGPRAIAARLKANIRKIATGFGPKTPPTSSRFQVFRERIGDLKIKLRQVLSASRPFSAVGNLVKLSIVRLKKAVERLIPRKNRASDVRTAASSIRSKRLIFSGRRKILAWLLSEPGRNSLKVSPAIKRANRPIRSYAIKRLKRALRRRSLREERQQRFEQTILNFFFNLALLKRRGYVISLSRFGAYHAGRSQRRGAKRGTVLPNTRKNVMRHKEHKDH